MTPDEFYDLMAGKKPKRTKNINRKDVHIINWTVNSHNQEPYIKGELFTDYLQEKDSIPNVEYHRYKFNRPIE
ncbi:hypothetical protein [Ligilactobacillus acidipiscis]|uniref:hypothetical protein n=1 Tax=Ligilactobacillus acidipiscis TaxID=89059 RepID=UPI0023F6E4FA|nr:hypothetical protein [Ligilactobacillus acidipiscis]WEV56146.1 hypothetical protein OZX66_07770 [Ligilactobacillus acidipiscis]